MRHLLSLAVGRLPDVAIDEAGDGVAALKALRASAGAPYDLIFLDLNMPLMDGLKVLGMVQSDPTLAGRTTVAVVTTTENPESEKQARSLGAKYFIRKPVSRRAVDKILSEVFGW